MQDFFIAIIGSRDVHGYSTDYFQICAVVVSGKEPARSGKEPALPSCVQLYKGRFTGLTASQPIPGAG